LNPHVRELTSENWDSEVLQAGEPVLVDFWAGWCAPCRTLAPTIDAVAEEFAGRVKVGKLDIDQHGALAERYDIRSIPTLLVFKNGRVVEQRIGGLPKAQLALLLDQHVATTAG
jgi:thioredoxin 1